MAVSKLAALGEGKLPYSVECSVCSYIFKDPRSLPCGHTFCLACLESCCQDKKPGDTVQCQLCKENFVLLESGAKGFPKNTFIEELKIKQKLLYSKESSCDACSSGESCSMETEQLAVAFCTVCQQNLCISCDSTHRCQKAQEVAELGHRRDQTAYCEEHVGEKVELYCEDCKVLLCTMCFLTSHSSHSCHDSKDTVAEFRHRMTRDVASMVDAVDKCCQMLKDLSMNKLAFTRKIEEIAGQVCDTAEKLKQTIELNKQTLLAELKAIRQERLSQCTRLSFDLEQQLTSLNVLKHYTEQLSQQGSARDVATEVDVLHDRTDELLCLDEVVDEFEEFGSLSVTFSSSSRPIGTGCDVANIVGQVDVISLSGGTDSFINGICVTVPAAVF